MPAAVNPAQHYIPVTESGCWLWLGKVRPDGYGSHRNGLAHRLSYESANGPIPAGMLICHKCDTKTCINPAHLFAGTYADNHDDMRRKRRQAVGESHGMAKLTREQAEVVRSRALAGENQRAIAADFGITQVMVSRIKLGKAWYGGKYA